MTNNNIIKGVFLVGLGATSYGMLATFVKLAYQEGFTTAEVTSSQFIYGIIGILLINLFQRQKTKATVIKASKKNIFQLMLAGTSLGMTSVFYYLCVSYIDVSIAIVMLMQTVWIGVLLEWFLDKKAPSKQKIVAVVIVLIGTLLATNLLNSSVEIDWRGILFGFLAACSFTTTMFTANKIALGISSAQRSLYMLLGGAVIVAGFALYAQILPNNFEFYKNLFTYNLKELKGIHDFNFEIFMKWGIVLALFGTIIPPMLMNSGFPHIGLGLGSIVSSLELPVSVMMAFFILNETVIASQWFGVVLIVFAIVIMNINFSKFRK